jgi:hypothetical protein
MEILEDSNWISKQKTLCLPNGWVSLLYSKWIPLAIFFFLDQIMGFLYCIRNISPADRDERSHESRRELNKGRIKQ